MSYTKINWVDNSAPYINAENLNAMEQGIYEAHEFIDGISQLPCTYNEAGSTAGNISLTTGHSQDAPDPSELPISLVFISGVTNNAGATITTEWGSGYIKDKSTNDQIGAGVIKAGQPCEVYYDGTNWWYAGDGRYLQYALVGSNVNGYWDKSTTNPTGTQRLNYSGYLYTTRLYGAVYNPSADIAECYHVDGECVPGDLIAIEMDGSLWRNDILCNDRVLGFVSDEYAVCLGVGKGETPIAIAGRVHVNCVGPIRPGDYLVGSSVPGRVQSAKDDLTNIPRGAIVAQALEVDVNGKVLANIVRM